MDMEPEAPSAERVALEKVLASAEFSRSERLSAFLAYVCEAALTQKNLRLTEQHIGIHVFGRPDNYIPAEDTIVRTTAAMLRKRLAKYYESEGLGDPVRIAIPRGSYSPVFVANDAVAPVAASPAPFVLDPTDISPEPQPDIQSSPTPRHWRNLLTVHKYRTIFGAFTALLLVAIVGAFAAPEKSTDPVDAFWKSLLFAGHETLFIPADSELVMHQRATGRQISLDDYIAKRFDASANNAHGPAPPTFHWRRYTGVISVTLAVELGKLAANAPHGLRVRYARDLQLNDLKQSNAVLVGTADANPWVSLFRDRLNYHIDLDVPNDRILVRNDAPAAGERALIEFAGTEREKHGFAVLAYIPNLSGNGHVLMIGGTSSVGTEAGMDFLLDRERLRAVLTRAMRPDGSVRPFEILLQCALRASGTTDVQVIGVRIK